MAFAEVTELDGSYGDGARGGTWERLQKSPLMIKSATLTKSDAKSCDQPSKPAEAVL